MKRAAIVIVLRRRPGEEARVLAVTNRGYGGMSFPGGKAEPHEDPRMAAMRELREETGLIALSRDLVVVSVGLSARPDNDTCEVSVFFARHVLGHERDVEDGTHHAWVTFDELCELSPFKEFYRRHFPGGIEHIRETIRDSGPMPSRTS